MTHHSNKNVFIVLLLSQWKNNWELVVTVHCKTAFSQKHWQNISSAMQSFIKNKTDNSYHCVFCLDRFDMLAILHSSGGAVGFLWPVCFSPCMLCLCLIFSIPFRRVRFRWYITTLLLSDMCFWTMNGLHMFPERTGVCIAFCATWDLTHIWFLQRSDR